MIVLAWTAVGLFSISQMTLDALARGAPTPRALFVVGTLVDVWIWAAFTPAILALTARVPIPRDAWARPVLFHAGASLALAFVDVLVDAALAPVFGPPRPPPLAVAFVRQSFMNVASYWVVLAIGHLATYRRLWLERRVHAAELEAQLSDARLRALEMQLRPHFLFNALHTISALVRRGDVQHAVRTIAQLGDLLRAVLRADAQEVPLREELAFAERYLAIERSRFGDRLAVEIDAEPAAAGALVPRLILQPLVENAVRHGIEPRPEPGRVAVRAARRGDTLCLEVADTGPGPSAVARTGGVGLENTRARLRHLYGDRQRLALEGASGGGALVRVELPWRVAEEVRRAG
ncbi:MAG TPA: sensor histidine kinase [Anaeromyxobacteraceae bacterium]|nr:sensor histidine kinase [Anaeromyxobacteraceae bacterium]